MSQCDKKYEKFDHTLGEVIGGVLRWFGALFMLFCIFMGVCVLADGALQVMVGWYHKDGYTLEVLSRITMTAIGIIILVVDYVRALLRGIQNRLDTKTNQENDQPDDG